MRLEGKVAIVTGASTGMGKAIAIEFVKEGAKVAVVARRPDKLKEVVLEIEKIGGEGVAITADVSNLPDVDRIVNETVRTLGRLDILVNCAGVMTNADLAHHTEKIWDDTIDINLKGSFFCIQKAVPEMLKQGKGKIINIASICGEIGLANSSAYCASKAGMTGLTKALAVELAPQKINVNSINPGYIETSLNEHFLRVPEIRRAVIESTPYRRIGKVSDVAPAAVYLASDESDFVNGAALFVDGGWVSV